MVVRVLSLVNYWVIYSKVTYLRLTINYGVKMNSSVLTLTITK